MTNFSELGLSPKLLQALDTLGYDTPTPIQRDAIPLVLAGHDLMGLAQTGTGKTAAFGLPLVQLLMKGHIKPDHKTVGALILAPTRELVNQIAANLRDYTRKTPLKINCVVGGSSINVQIRNLQRGSDILVATPGRLLDLVNRNAVILGSARYLVLDEADQMLDMGFIHDLKKIAKLLGTPRQTLLFSATMPKTIEDLSRSYLNDPVRIQVATPGKAADKVRQCVHYVAQPAKMEKLHNCLIERRDDLSLVFARTKHGAEKLMKQLVASGFKASSIHGNKSQGQRERAIKAFREGEIRILVATDVAARGIDIPGVSHVYNFDLPEVAENYVHRIGRTARAGAGGEAVAFCGPHELHLLRDIEKLMGIQIAVTSGEEPDRKVADAARLEKGRQANRGNRSGGRPRRTNTRDGAAKPGGGQLSAKKKRPRRSGAKSSAPANTPRNAATRQRGKPAAQQRPANSNKRRNTKRPRGKTA